MRENGCKLKLGEVGKRWGSCETPVDRLAHDSGTGWEPSQAVIVSFVVLILTLLFRPTGLFATPK